MLVRILPIIAALVFACRGSATPDAGTTTRRPAPHGERRVHGKLLGHQGRPMLLAHARVVDGLGNALRQVAIGSDGAFSIALDRIAEPVVKLELTGVDHRRTTLLLAPDEGDIEVTATLGTYAAMRRPGSPSVLLFRRGRPHERVPMLLQNDGTYIAEFRMPNGRHGYEIDGLTAEGNTINNTSTAGGYEYDGDGDYQSFVEVTDGKATIAFDPARRPKAGVAPHVTLGAPRGPSAVLSAIFDRALVSLRDQAFDPAMRNDILAAAGRSPHPVVRRMANVLYFAAGRTTVATDVEREMATRLLAEIAPDSSLWGLAASALPVVVAAAGDSEVTARYVADVVAKHPSTALVGMLLVELLQRAGNDANKMRPLIAQLRQPRFAGTDFEMFATMFDPDRLLAPGKPLPAFEVDALAPAKGKPNAYTAASFARELTLIDVWATWCKPCVADLPRLQAVHAKYGKRTQPGKRLRVLSISIDQAPDAVVKFQTDPAHAMPWDQAFLGLEGLPELKRAFGWSGAVPLYVLVGTDGKIVASSPALSLRGLPAVLDQVLGKP